VGAMSLFTGEGYSPLPASSHPTKTKRGFTFKKQQDIMKSKTNYLKKGL